MANIKKTKDDALAIINAALTILDRFPEFDETNTSLSINTSTNPFTFLMDLFKTTAGYNVFLKIISSYIAFALPALELSIKGILLTNIKNLLTCSLNPFITRELLLNGIVFDLRTIDVINMLSYSPFDKVGKYYYFGCDGFDYTDQLVKAGDFNAFLWHTKNKSLRRQVWYGVNIIKSNVDSSLYEDEEGNSTILQKEPKGNPPSKGEIDNEGKLKKCKKSDGIITIQYCERPNRLRNSEGNGVSYLQTPHNHCLQVFLGNVQETDTNIPVLENAISAYDKQITEHEDKIYDLEDELENVVADINTLQIQLQEQQIEREYYENNYNLLSNEETRIRNAIIGHQESIDTIIPQKLVKIRDLKNALSGTLRYRNIEQNYYYRRTLIEFNTDYVMSLKLFDSKTVAAQLIDTLTGCLSIDLHLSYEQLLIKYETQRMVKSVVETDDTVVSDCFFTFSNADYDKMLQKSELAREGLYAMNVDNPTGVKVDAESILNSLNTINEGSSKETVQSVIEGSLTEISKMLSDVRYEETDKLNFGAEINFIENIMNNLAYVITMSILSPKVYLLLAINLQLLGQQTNFNINDFIEMHRQLIVQILRAVRDALIQYLVDELMKILADLAKEVAVKLTIEQAQYYMRLIRKLIDCFRRKRGTLDFNIDNVDYSDILQEEEEPKEDEC
jgi:hypothetical protein